LGSAKTLKREAASARVGVPVRYSSAIRPLVNSIMVEIFLKIIIFLLK
jgi:hypothetical protein